MSHVWRLVTRCVQSSVSVEDLERTIRMQQTHRTVFLPFCANMLELCMWKYIASLLIPTKTNSSIRGAADARCFTTNHTFRPQFIERCIPARTQRHRLAALETQVHLSVRVHVHRPKVSRKGMTDEQNGGRREDQEDTCLSAAVQCVACAFAHGRSSSPCPVTAPATRLLAATHQLAAHQTQQRICRASIAATAFAGAQRRIQIIICLRERNERETTRRSDGRRKWCSECS